MALLRPHVGAGLTVVALLAPASLFEVRPVYGRATLVQVQPGQPQPASRAAQSASPSSESAAQNQPITRYSLRPDKYAQAVAYSRARYTLYFIDAAYGLLVLLEVLRWRLAPRFRDWAEGNGAQRRFVQALVYTPLLVLTLAVLGLPTDVAEHWISRHYQQSIEGWGGWFWDWSKE